MAVAVVTAVIIAEVIVAMVVFVIILQDAERRIPVQYSKKMQGRKMVGGQSTSIPLKVNTAGVIPVIFASSLMSFPVVIAGFFQVNYDTIGGKILLALNSIQVIGCWLSWTNARDEAAGFLHVVCYFKRVECNGCVEIRKHNNQRDVDN